MLNLCILFLQIIHPQGGGYWIDGSDSNNSYDNHLSHSQTTQPLQNQEQGKVKFETDETAKIYRRHFMGKVS